MKWAARIVVALVVLITTANAVQSPVEWEPLDQQSWAWFCSQVAEWKAIMRRDYPDHDRSIPSVERRCHLPRETVG